MRHNSSNHPLFPSLEVNFTFMTNLRNRFGKVIFMVNQMEPPISEDS